MSPLNSPGQTLESGGLKNLGTTLKNQIPGKIHQWEYKEGSGSTVADTIEGEDGTQNNWSWASGTYWQDNAADMTDGANHYTETTTLSDWGSNHIKDSFTVLYTIENVTDDGWHWGSVYNLGGGSSQIFAATTTGGFGGTTDTIGLLLRDNSDYDTHVEVSSGGNVTDGNKHRIALVRGSEDDGSNWKIYVDNTEKATSVARNNFNSSNFGGDLVSKLHHGQANEDGGQRNGPSSITFDNMIISTDKLSADQINQDYNNQPWT